jgi:hypothetical protein
MVLGELLKKSLWFWGAIATLAGLTGALTIAILLTVNGSPETSDTLALLANEIDAAILLLAVSVAILAIAGYRTAARAPELEAEIKFHFCEPNRPVLAISVGPGPARSLVTLRESKTGTVEVFPQLEAQLSIRNRKSWSAQHAALRVNFVGLGLPPTFQPGLWSVANRDRLENVLALKWQANADETIHGGWTHELPPLDLAGLTATGERPPAIELDIVAEGFRKVTKVPVELITLDKWDAMQREATIAGRWKKV